LLIPGSLLFCPNCGTLLALPQGDEQIVTCEQCHHEEPASCTSYPMHINCLILTHLKPTKTQRSSLALTQMRSRLR
ncbi:putative DNA-directed RNA polymerase, partial [Butyriboletus roseoflavus]